MQWCAIKIDAIADADGTLSENLLSIREGDQCIHVLIQAMAEQLVYPQSQTLFEGKSFELLVIGISRNLCYCVDASFLQSFEETDKPRIGVHETAGIDEFDMFTNAIIIDAVETHTLADSSPRTLAVILYHCIINIAATMTVRSNVVIAHMHLMTILPQALDLCQHLFRDTAGLLKTVISQE